MNFARSHTSYASALPDPHLQTAGWSVETELSSNYSRLLLAAQRLKDAPGPHRMLLVSHHNIDRAEAALRALGLSAWLRTLWGDEGGYVRADWPPQG